MPPLFHFTSLPALESILQTGAILPTESNVGTPWDDPVYPSGNHAGPPVVHLLDLPSADAHNHGLKGSLIDKKQTRIEVKRVGVPWRQWEFTHLMSPRWRTNLENAAGAGASEHWWVFPAELRSKLWLSVAVRDSEAIPIPDEYRPYLSSPDEAGYSTVSPDLISVLSLPVAASVRPSL